MPIAFLNLSNHQTKQLWKKKLFNLINWSKNFVFRDHIIWYNSIFLQKLCNVNYFFYPAFSRTNNFSKMFKMCLIQWNIKTEFNIKWSDRTYDNITRSNFNKLFLFYTRCVQEAIFFWFINKNYGWHLNFTFLLAKLNSLILFFFKENVLLYF